MAFGAADFARRMNVIAERVGRNSERAVRQAALTADQILVTSTPVDTGRARANWVVSIGNPILTAGPTPATPEAGARAALEEGQIVISGWVIGSGPIFIANNVPYIVALDQGSSAQAPQGMSAAAVQAAAAILDSARLLD